MTHDGDSPLGLHPKYGLADDTRLKILKDAELYGVLEAARLNNIGKSSIYRWRQRLNPER